jgi:predicted RNA-binding Zn-ribbon protein involved in translation (DUF1610 family)
VATFKDGELCKIVYRRYQHLDTDADIEYSYLCPSCGGSIWKSRKRFGTKKATKGGAVKFICVKCGQWFIVSEDYVSKCGGVLEKTQ